MILAASRDLIFTERSSPGLRALPPRRRLGAGAPRVRGPRFGSRGPGVADLGRRRAEEGVRGAWDRAGLVSIT